MISILLAASLSLASATDSLLPTAEILLPGLKVVQVKAKIVSRLMNREWQIRQSKNDSLDFTHIADSGLVAGLFQEAYQPKQRVQLRFGLHQLPDGVRTRLQAFLLTPDSLGRLRRSPTPADSTALRQNLESIQQEEFGHGALIPTADKPKKKRK
jgi:hypothetical protein